MKTAEQAKTRLFQIVVRDRHIIRDRKKVAVPQEFQWTVLPALVAYGEHRKAMGETGPFRLWEGAL